MVKVFHSNYRRSQNICGSESQSFPTSKLRNVHRSAGPGITDGDALIDKKIAGNLPQGYGLIMRDHRQFVQESGGLVATFSLL